MTIQDDTTAELTTTNLATQFLEDVAQIRGRLDALRKTVDGMDANINGLDARVADAIEHGADAEALNTQLMQVKHQRDVGMRRVAELEEHYKRAMIGYLGNRITELKDKIAALSEQRKALKDSIWAGGDNSLLKANELAQTRLNQLAGELQAERGSTESAEQRGTDYDKYVQQHARLDAKREALQVAMDRAGATAKALLDAEDQAWALTKEIGLAQGEMLGLIGEKQTLHKS